MSSLYSGYYVPALLSRYHWLQLAENTRCVICSTCHISNTPDLDPYLVLVRHSYIQKIQCETEDGLLYSSFHLCQRRCCLFIESYVSRLKDKKIFIISMLTKNYNFLNVCKNAIPHTVGIVLLKLVRWLGKPAHWSVVFWRADNA